jgi:anaerobic selenocysteine-containing dehydrogenase
MKRREFIKSSGVIAVASIAGLGLKHYLRKRKNRELFSRDIVVLI